MAEAQSEHLERTVDDRVVTQRAAAGQYQRQDAGLAQLPARGQQVKAGAPDARRVPVKIRDQNRHRRPRLAGQPVGRPTQRLCELGRLVHGGDYSLAPCPNDGCKHQDLVTSLPERGCQTLNGRRPGLEAGEPDAAGRPAGRGATRFA